MLTKNKNKKSLCFIDKEVFSKTIRKCNEK